MSTATETLPNSFVDRRNSVPRNGVGVERRQFGNTYDGLTPNAKELAEAIDGYKIRHRRRYITFEEMLNVIRELGYRKADDVLANKDELAGLRQE